MMRELAQITYAGLIVTALYFLSKTHKDNFSTMPKYAPFFDHLIFQQSIVFHHYNMDTLCFVGNIGHHITATATHGSNSVASSLSIVCSLSELYMHQNLLS